MNKIAITGSSGRIGRAIHWKLSKGYPVIGLDVSPGSSTSRIVDIRDYDQVMRSLEGVKVVFHTAALHAPHVGKFSERDFYHINVKATELICRAAKELGVSQIIFTSTTALYGYANCREGEAAWINEKTVPQPKTIYHQTKLEAERVLQAYSGKDLQISVIRMSRAFPEPAHTMAVFRLHRGVDYRDVADAHVLAWSVANPKDFDMFVVSGSTPFLPEDVQSLYLNPEEVIRKRAPELSAELDKRGWRFPISIDRIYDSSYAQEALGWKPKWGYEEVFRQFDREDFEVLPYSND